MPAGAPALGIAEKVAAWDVVTFRVSCPEGALMSIGRLCGTVEILRGESGW